MDSLIWKAVNNYLHDSLVIGILCTILGAYVATKIYYRFWDARDDEISKKLFRSIWISSKQFEYKDLSGRKHYSEKNPSTQYHLTNKTLEILDQKKNVLLVSEPMAGKTHFTVNFLKKLENAYLLIPDCDNFDKLFDSFPEAPTKAKFKIVLLDDIHTYINTGITRLASFIGKAIDENYIIWANTISGSEFEIVRNNIPIKLLSTFSEVTIPSTLSKEEALKISMSEGIEILPAHFDGNIGSLFSDIFQVRERYSRLDEIGKLLLLVIKQLYLVGMYRPPAQVLKSDVRALFDSYEPNISSETIAKFINELIKMGFLLSNLDPKSVSFEEKYLRIVVSPDLKVKDFMNSISQIFPKNVATFTQAMQSASDYIEAEKIYQEMRSENIQPGVRPFAVLIGKANDSDVGLTWLKEMDKLGVPTDDYIINILFRTTSGDIEKKERVISELASRNIEVKEKIRTLVLSPKFQLDLYGYSNLMNLSGSYEKALTIFAEMKQAGIIPNAFFYNILIRLSPDLIEGKKLLNEMISSKILPDNVTYGTLMNLSKEFFIGKQLLYEMIEKGLSPSPSSFGRLINIAPNYEEGKKLFEDMKRRGIAPTRKEYGTLINISPNFLEGKNIFDEMTRAGVAPTDKEYSTLINISPNFLEGKKLHDEMIIKGITPNAISYGTLINLAGDYKLGEHLLYEMSEKKIKPIACIFGTLMKLSKDFQISKKYFIKMEEEGITPTIEIFGTLIGLSKDFQTANEIFKEMKNRRILPNVEIYGTLINVCGHFPTGKQLFDEMKEKGIKPNSAAFGTLMNLSGSYKIAKQLYDEMSVAKIEPGVGTYGTLIRLSGQYLLGKKIFDEMLGKGIKPNGKTYGTLITLSRDYKIGKQLFDEMIKGGLKPRVETFGALMNLSRDYMKRKEVFDEMMEKGIKPNVEIFTMLIRAARTQDIAKMHFEEMLAMKIQPNVWTYNALIWSNKHNYQEAISILKNEMPRQKICPDVVTYTQLMNISKMFSIAFRLYEEMIDRGISPNQNTFRVLETLAGKNAEFQAKYKMLLEEHYS